MDLLVQKKKYKANVIFTLLQVVLGVLMKNIGSIKKNDAPYSVHKFNGHRLGTVGRNTDFNKCTMFEKMMKMLLLTSLTDVYPTLRNNFVLFFSYVVTVML